MRVYHLAESSVERHRDMFRGLSNNATVAQIAALSERIMDLWRDDHIHIIVNGRYEITIKGGE